MILGRVTGIHFSCFTEPSLLYSTIGQNFYQTYARITGNEGYALIFLGPFLALNTGNKQKISRETLFLFRAKVGLRETLVIVLSEY